MFALILALLAAEPLSLHPDNPHYYQFRGKPTVLVTSGEHYGAVLNADFDYLKYLDTLAKDGLNLTRIFTGVYREVPGDFGIARNTLAPRDAAFVSPDSSGYWQRLKKFIAAAGERGIVVEVTVFCVYYQDAMWKASPWSKVFDIPRGEALTLKHAALVKAQEEFVRRLAAELKDFDNILYEICNEPYINPGVGPGWEEHIAKVLREADGSRHLIAQNIANGSRRVDAPLSEVSVLNFHYARPPVTVALNYSLNRIIGFDETGFDGTMDATYRIQAWDFLLAGGAHYNNLDYSFVAGHEDGTFDVPGYAPGGGSAALRRQLRTLKEFFDGMQFVKMRPAPEVLLEAAPARVLAEEGKTYALYLQHGRVLAGETPHYVVATGKRTATLNLNLPAGRYEVLWVHPRTGEKAESTFTHTGGGAQLATPEYSEDLAVRLRRLP